MAGKKRAKKVGRKVKKSVPVAVTFEEDPFIDWFELLEVDGSDFADIVVLSYW